MRYFEKIMQMRYFTYIILLTLVALVVVGFILFYLIGVIKYNRKIKWLEKNGFERGVVDFGNNTGYKKDGVCFTDKEIEKYSLKEIKILVTLRSTFLLT